MSLSTHGPFVPHPDNPKECARCGRKEFTPEGTPTHKSEGGRVTDEAR